jgi:putative copper resistance protein D
MPVTLALRASASRARRRVVLRIVHSGPVRVLTHPLVAWTLFAGVMVGTHFSPLYEAALEHVWIHDLEHALYLASGLLFWWPMVGLDPSPWRMPHPLRLLYLFVAGPVNTFTALAIYSAKDLLYPFYATVQRSWGPTPLQDQQWAGALMWIVGDLILLISVVFAAAAWMRHDQAEAVRLDRRLDAERDHAPPRPG